MTRRESGLAAFERVILRLAGTITARRRRRNGNTITSDQAREMQARSAEARKANRGTTQ